MCPAEPRRRVPLPLRMVLAILAATTPPAFADSSRQGDTGMPSQTAPTLVEFFNRFLKDHDLEGYRRDVGARYTESTLCRVLHLGDVRSRRAAVLALGVAGGIGSNAAIARTLKDADPTVRALAVNALWAIWSRADTPENVEALDEVQTLIGRGHLAEAIRKANALIARSPTFAEAVNQRAIAYFFNGQLAESAVDCRRVLELNPYHFGAMSGLGQCQIGLRQRAEAIRTFRRALELQPYSDGLRETVAELEAADD